jgi:hypothetical protein
VAKHAVVAGLNAELGCLGVFLEKMTGDIGPEFGEFLADGPFRRDYVFLNPEDSGIAPNP